MRAAPPLWMTTDEFLAWAMAQPEGERYELVAGKVVAMSPERAAHGRTKVTAHDRLREAIAAAGLPCEAFIDGMAVRIDDATIYEPDLLLRCGTPVDDDCVEITDPVVGVEVLLPSSRRKDTGGKLEDYFRLPSVRHYLMVKTDSRTVIRHSRETDDRLRTRVICQSTIILDPPGISAAAEALFP